MTRMRSVRVIKGPSSIPYGPQSIGGAVDLRTRGIPSGKERGGVDLALGSHAYRKAHAYVGIGNDRAGALVEGVHLGSGGFKELDGGGDTGFYRNEWMAKTRYLLDPSARVQNEFRLKVGYSDERSHETYLGLTDSDFRDNPRRRYRASALDNMGVAADAAATRSCRHFFPEGGAHHQCVPPRSGSHLGSVSRISRDRRGRRAARPERRSASVLRCPDGRPRRRVLR